MHVASIRNSEYKSWMFRDGLRIYKDSASHLVEAYQDARDPEEFRQEAGPDVIRRLAHGAMAWLMLHDYIPFVFELRTAYT